MVFFPGGVFWKKSCCIFLCVGCVVGSGWFVSTFVVLVVLCPAFLCLFFLCLLYQLLDLGVRRTFSDRLCLCMVVDHNKSTAFSCGFVDTEGDICIGA